MEVFIMQIRTTCPWALEWQVLVQQVPAREVLQQADGRFPHLELSRTLLTLSVVAREVVETVGDALQEPLAAVVEVEAAAEAAEAVAVAGRFFALYEYLELC